MPDDPIAPVPPPDDVGSQRPSPKPTKAATSAAVEAPTVTDSGEQPTEAVQPGELVATAFLREKHDVVIGRYRLRTELGKGGFGLVWQAEQTEPIRRDVALKIIKPGMDSREIIARFEAERQALALMDHPNIAAVLDAGTTDRGLPYFVMELVKGVPITEYCDARKLGIRERLELFIPVCQAVQHAHQKAILHRDLKPSNILVTEVDGKPVPKVIDFGIAKALGATQDEVLQASVAHTREGMIVGTPQYMSPEQAGSVPDVDTRSDIYTLGVILYELLVGDTPLGRKQLQKAALDEVLRVIREAEPSRPSSRFTPATELAKTTATLRHSEPKKLGHALRGDLDWIVLKALEKDRTRRYETANAFALDLRLHLDDEPVNAGPPSALYRLKKLVRRNKVAVLASIFMGTAFIAATAISLTGEAAAKKSERSARQSAAAEKQAKLEAETMVIRLELQRAEELAAKHDASGELAYLARVLRRNLEDASTANRLLSALRDQSHLLPLLDPIPHSASVSWLEFSPNGKMLLTIANSEARIWDSATGRQLLGPLQKGELAWTEGHFSPDGRKIALSGVDTQIFDVNTGAALTPLLKHPNRYHVAEHPRPGATFNRDGTLIVTRSNLTNVIVWRVADGQPALPPMWLGPHQNYDFPCVCSFSPNGRILAVGATSGKLMLWDTGTGENLFVQQFAGDEIITLTFLGEGNDLLVAARDGNVRTLDVSQKEFHDWKIAQPEGISCAVVSPDQTKVFVASGDGEVRQWNLLTGQPVGTVMAHGAPVQDMKISSDGDRLVTTTTEPRIWVWGIEPQRLLIAPRRLPSSIFSTSLNPDGASLATGCADGTASLWRLEPTGALPLLFDDGSKDALAAISPDGKVVVIGDRETATIKTWNAATGQRFGSDFGSDGRLWVVKFSPDGRYLMTGGTNARASAWSFDDLKKPVREFLSNGSVGHLFFSPDGRRLCVVGNGVSSRIYDFATAEPTGPEIQPTKYFAAFDGGGERIAIQNGGSATVIECKGGRILRGMATHGAPINDLRADPSGQYFATASNDSTARVWKFDPTTPVSPPLAHRNSVQSIDFSPDGQRLASASSDHTAQVWNWKSGEAIGNRIEHGGPVYDVRFSPDGTRLATASADRTIRIWDAKSGLPISVPLSPAALAYELTWTRDGQRLFATDVTAQSLWDTPLAPVPAPSWLADWAEAIGGEKLDASGQLVTVGFDEYSRFRRFAEQISGEGLYERTVRWFFSSSKDRSISPDLKVSIGELVGRISGTAAASTLQKLQQLVPEDSRLKARMIILTANRTGALDPKWAAEAALSIERGKAANPQEPSVWLADSLLSDKQGHAAEARIAANRATELAPDDFEPWSQLADLLNREGDNAGACEALTKAIRVAKYNRVVRHSLLEERIPILVKLGRLEEAKNDACAARGIPSRSLEVTSAQIDLSLHYNASLVQRVGANAELEAVPQGLQAMAGTKFDVRGVVQLRSVSKDPRNTDSYPDKVTGISIAQPCRKLHFLHAARNTNDGTPRPIASYIIHYEDGSREEALVMLGHDIAEHLDFAERIPPRPLVVAWSGRHAVNGKMGGISLFKMSWQNPHPEKVIKSVDFVSNMTDSAPFLVAITAEY